MTHPELWMISNRQPWVHALLSGMITCKTRSPAVALPPVGSTVLLHASKALWRGWNKLWWAGSIDAKTLPRGGVVGYATLVEKGPTDVTMPKADRVYFRYDKEHDYPDCAAPVTMRFENITPLPFIIHCRGVQVPTRKIPPEVLEILGQHFPIE